MEKIQQEINNLFSERLKSYSGGNNLSIPHIPRISKNFHFTKTVVIGQETNTWYRKGNDDLKNIFLKDIDKITNICLESRYDKFISEEAANYKGMFWKFNRLLYEKNILEGKMIENGMLSHVWLNTFVTEACKCKKDKNGRPTKNINLQKKVIDLQQDLVYQVLKILSPKNIIILTGHSVDNVLRSYVLKSHNIDFIRIDKRNIIDKWKLAQIKIKDESHPLYNCNIIRCYHPSYFLGYINGNKKISSNLKKNKLTDTPSKYYTNLLLNQLTSFNA